jgi:tetratricopeptide (TPR) repeat protein
MHRATLRDFARSRELLEEAAARAPHVPEVHAWLAKWHVLGVTNRWSTDFGADAQRALDHTARALDLSPNNAFSLTIDGFAQNALRRNLDIAGKRYEAALDANPSEALAWLMKASLHTFRYEGAAAVEAAARARSLSPLDPFGHYYDALEAGANLSAENYERALLLAERSLQVNDRHLSTIRIKIFALNFMGRIDEARAAGADLLKRQPDFTVDAYMKIHPCADFKMGAMMENALRSAGLP